MARVERTPEESTAMSTQKHPQAAVVPKNAVARVLAEDLAGARAQLERDRGRPLAQPAAAVCVAACDAPAVVDHVVEGDGEGVAPGD